MLPLIVENEEKPQVSSLEMDELLAIGWRHFGTSFFRYNYTFYEDQLAVVMPLRIDLQRFVFSKSQKKNLRKNEDTEVLIKPLEIDKTKINLFESHKQKFKENPPESIFEVISAENPAQKPCNALDINVLINNELIACSFMDVGEKSTSGIYGFYDLAESERSLGIFTMLKEIEWSLANEKKYYYPGYAYDIPSFYDYKKRFSGLEYFDWQGNWKELV